MNELDRLQMRSKMNLSSFKLLVLLDNIDGKMSTAWLQHGEPHVAL